MLIYHPAFDIYHCIFRVLRLLENRPREEVEIDRVRILDFYLLFPALLRDVRFPIGHVKLKKYFSALDNVYENIDDPKALFIRLEPYQMAALHALATHGLIDHTLLTQRKVIRTAMALPADLARAVSTRNQGSKDVELLAGPLFTIDLYGKSGLKERTDLFEYRYDVA